MKKKILIYFLTFSFCFQSHALDRRPYYIIQPHDVLSQILYEARLIPVYGKNGSLNFIKSENKGLLTNIDQVWPGQKIYFPEKMAAQAERSGQLEQLNSGQLIRVNKQPSAEEKTTPPIEKPELQTTPETTSSESKSIFGFKLNYQFSRINTEDTSTGGTSTLLSKLNPKYEVSWYYDWDSNWKSVVSFSSLAIDFEPEINQNKTYSISKNKIDEIHLGVLNRFNDKLAFSVFYSRGASLLLRATTATQLTIDQANTNKIKLGLDWHISKFDSADFGLYINAAQIIDAGNNVYNVKPGLKTEMEAYLRHSIDSYNLIVEGSLFYSSLRQNSDYSLLTENSFGAGLNLIKRFGH